VEPAATVALSAIAAAGFLLTLNFLSTEAMAMQGSHWMMLLVAIVAGYVAGRMFPKPAQMVGLP
jgi:hypothetical protein